MPVGRCKLLAGNYQNQLEDAPAGNLIAGGTSCLIIMYHEKLSINLTSRLYTGLGSGHLIPGRWGS